MFLPLAAAINQAVEAQPAPIRSDEEYEQELRRISADLSPYAAQRFLEIIGDDWHDIPAMVILHKVVAERAAGRDL